jgi:type I restriction-modification system DNA methylase subunit
MLTSEIRSQIDQIWNAFWSGGISNPLEVIEQITYLLFIKRLDELRTLVEEHKLDAVISLPSGVFKPYAGVSTAILLFTKPTRVVRITSGSTMSKPTA